MRADIEASQKISGGGTVHIFKPSNCKRLKFAVVEMNNERYPAKGRAKNTNQVEGIFIIEGQFYLTIGTKKFRAQAGDIFYFEENVLYSVQGQGKVLVAIAPAETGKTVIE